MVTNEKYGGKKEERIQKFCRGKPSHLKQSEGNIVVLMKMTMRDMHTANTYTYTGKKRIKSKENVLHAVNGRNGQL